MKRLAALVVSLSVLIPSSVRAQTCTTQTLPINTVVQSINSNVINTNVVIFNLHKLRIGEIGVFQFGPVSQLGQVESTFQVGEGLGNTTTTTASTGGTTGNISSSVSGQLMAFEVLRIIGPQDMIVRPFAFRSTGAALSIGANTTPGTQTSTTTTTGTSNGVGGTGATTTNTGTTTVSTTANQPTVVANGGGTIGQVKGYGPPIEITAIITSGLAEGIDITLPNIFKITKFNKYGTITGGLFEVPVFNAIGVVPTQTIKTVTPITSTSTFTCPTTGVTTTVTTTTCPVTGAVSTSTSSSGGNGTTGTPAGTTTSTTTGTAAAVTATPVIIQNNKECPCFPCG